MRSTQQSSKQHRGPFRIPWQRAWSRAVEAEPLLRSRSTWLWKAASASWRTTPCTDSSAGAAAHVIKLLVKEHELAISKSARKNVYKRDRFCCKHCGWAPPRAPVEDMMAFRSSDGRFLTLDHLKPRAYGGSNLQSNLVTLCNVCNERKGASTRWHFTGSGVLVFA